MAKFRRGESGNLNGRPKGSISITSAIRRKLEEINPQTRRLYIDDLVDALVNKAIKEKDFRVMKEIWNHIDGSPRQTSEDLSDRRLPVPILAGLSRSFDPAFNTNEGNCLPGKSESSAQ